jgi:hypothetical protein
MNLLLPPLGLVTVVVVVLVTVVPGPGTVVVTVLVQDERNAIDPTVAPPTTNPASLRNSLLDSPVFFSVSDMFFKSTSLLKDEKRFIGVFKLRNDPHDNA